MPQITESFTQFIAFCQFQKNLSPKTLKAYRIDSDQFIIYLYDYNNIHQITDIDKEILRSYLLLLSNKYSIKTVKRKIACLKAFFNYLEFEDKITVNPFRKLRIKLKEPFKLPKVMSLNEINSILETAYSSLATTPNDNTYHHLSLLRDIAVLELLFATGLRVSELSHLKKESVNISESYIKVEGKGNKERIIFLGNEEVKIALKNYTICNFYNTSQSEYFFLNRLNQRLSEQSVRFMIKKYVKKTDIEKNITPHVFRHSFATLLLEEGVDIKYIQDFLGHSSIVTTQIYTHVNKEKQKYILTHNHPRSKLSLSNKG